jgi:hypothetical protein
MNREIATFQAKCGTCHDAFEHPSLGDQAYGEAVLTSADGKHYAWVSAFSEQPNRVGTLLPGASAKIFWGSIAYLADEVAGQKLTAQIHCALCGSDQIEFWQGERVGTMSVPETTFSSIAQTSSCELQERINDYVRHVTIDRD